MEIIKEKDNVFAGISWMVVTGLMFVAVTGIVRHVGSEIPAAQAAEGRSRRRRLSRTAVTHQSDSDGAGAEP